MANSAVLHVPSLPELGSILDIGDHVILPKPDHTNREVRHYSNLERIKTLDKECDILAEDVYSLTKELGETFDKLKEVEASSNEAIKEAKDKANSNIFNYRVIETKAIKAEKQLEQALSINKRRSEKIAEHKKTIKALEGMVKTAKKQLEDAKKSYDRKYIDPVNPTINIKYIDTRKGVDGKPKNMERLVVIQYTDHQIHVHDPVSAYLLSSQPLFSEDDYVPRFVGYPYAAALDQHDPVRERIEHAINQLAYDYRKANGKVLTADIRGAVSNQTRKKLWEAGIRFASELDDKNVIEKVKSLPGIGKKTLETLLIEAKKACKK